MPEQRSGNSLRQDDEAYESDDLLKKVAENLNNIEGGGEPEPDDDDPTLNADEEQTDDEDSTSDADDQTDDDDSTSDDSDDDSAETKSEPEPPAIPEHLYRAAQHSGWEPKDIVDLYKQNPKMAEKTFEKLHSDMNNLSQQFSQLGKVVREKQQPAQQQQVQQVQQVQQQDFVDVKKLREQYEDNPLVDMIAALNDGLKKAVGEKSEQPVPQPVVQQQQQNTVQDDMAALQQINVFLGAKDMGDYNDFYGPIVDANKFPLLDWRTLSPGQQANRHALTQEADLILVGAELVGRKMTIADALTMAHLKLTAPMQGQVARNKVVSQLKKRSKGVTLRTKGTKKAASTGGQMSDEQLEAVTAERLRRLNF